jgi:hypothetical protein
MRKILAALVLFAFIAGPASAGTVTLLSNSTSTGASAVVHSTASGSPGGLDAWTFTLTATGAPWNRRAQLQESLDGQNWSTVGLFVGAPLVRLDCGGCRFRSYVAGNPAGSALTVTATTTGNLTAATIE